MLSAADSTAFWVNHNRCNATAASHDYPDLDTQGASTVSSDTYSACDEGGEVKLFTVTGGGHVMPSIAEQISALWESVDGQQNHDIEDAEEMWRFSENRTLGGSCIAGNTGWLSPTANAADVGDGNGFELSAANAHVDSSGFASNMNGAGDRHRYYNYGVSIPAGCAIKGIEVRLEWWMNSIAWTNSLAAELSWNSGTNWTAQKPDTQETITEHNKALGGATDA